MSDLDNPKQPLVRDRGVLTLAHGIDRSPFMRSTESCLVPVNFRFAMDSPGGGSMSYISRIS